MAANLILPAGSAASADSTPADPVTRSLRFNDGDDSGLYFDPTATYDSETVYTFSCWAKLGELSNSSSQNIFSAGYYSSSSNQNFVLLRILSSRKISVRLANGSSDNNSHDSDALLRDPSAWYHLTLVRNGASLKVYVNNSEVISETISSTQKYGIYDSRPMHVGTYLTPTSTGLSNYDSFDGLLADAYFIDGEAKSPTDFIELGDYGNYIPKAYTGSFGTNGFHIDAQPAHDADLLVSSIDRNDGDTQFADCTGHTITKGGDPEHSVKVGNPFTGDDRAIYFDGTGDNLVVTSDSSFNEFGTGDFTIEMWVNPTDQGSGSFAQMFELYGSSSDRMYLRIERQSSQNVYKFVVNGSDNFDVESDSAPDYGNWQHLAVVRNGTSITMYVDGTAQTDSVTISSSATYNWPSTNLNIGKGSLGGSSADYEGYIFDYRITKGTAQYTGNFTPPTSKLSDDSSSLLLQPTKTDTSIGDSSSNSHTVTTAGSPTITASTPYDAAAKSTAMYFDGTGDYLSVATSSDFDFGSGSYTYEGWFYFNGFNETPDGIFSRNNSSTQEWSVCTNSSGTLQFFESINNSYNTSSFTFSTGQWYHIALCKNGTTYKVYVDGSEKISVTLSSPPDDSLPVIIGRFYDNYNGYYLDGYCFDFRAQKGVDTGGSKPSAPFELNPVYLGGDQSGNKNHFTPTNISGHDVMLDVPTKNYATLNPIGYIDEGTDPTFTEGNLKITGGTADNKIPSTIAVSSGKWYAEVRVNATANMMMGVAKTSAFLDNNLYLGQSGTTDSWMMYRPSGDEYNEGNSPNKISGGLTTGDILQIALDLDNNKLWWGKNDTWVGTVGTSGETTITAGEYYFAHGYSGGTATWNFGQDNTFGGLFTGTPNNAEFAYEVPTGFKSLNSSNLDAPAVTPSENFDIALWQGNNTNNRDITGLGFDPTDGVLTWVKNRDDSGGWHVLFDSVRGAGNQLASNETDTELASASNVGGKVSQWNTDGFRVAQGSGTTPLKSVNESSDDYVAWNWKAHQSSSSYNYNNTLTLTVEAYDQGYGSFSGWGTTKLEVIEGSTSLGFVSEPTTYDNDYGGYYVQYDIKTDDVSKIKLVWRTVDSDSDVFYDIYAYLENSSSTELASWDGYDYSGGGGEGPDAPETDDVFYPSSGHDSTNASTTGVLEEQGPTVEPNSEKYNAAAGFTMFTYTGNSSTNNDTMLFNHSLGVPIDFAIGKCRDTPASGTSGGKWVVWHKDLSYDYYSLYLNETESENDVGGDNYDTVTYDSAGWFANASTGSQHHVKIRNVEIYDGSNTDTVRMVDNSKDFVFYGFAGVEGYSKFGTYEGNGSTDGPFIYTGFRPRWIMVKPIDDPYAWYIHDTARSPYNYSDNELTANTSGEEYSVSGAGAGERFDIISNGFKHRTSNVAMNADNKTMVYAAFAESPFKHANAR